MGANITNYQEALEAIGIITPGERKSNSVYHLACSGQDKAHDGTFI